MRSILTRRDFVTRAACAGVGLALSARRSAAAQSGTSGMFVSLNGALTPKVSGADKIRLAAKTGYGGVDWDLGTGEDRRARDDEGALCRAEDQADDHQPADGPAAAIRRR